MSLGFLVVGGGTSSSLHPLRPALYNLWYPESQRNLTHLFQPVLYYRHSLALHNFHVLQQSGKSMSSEYRETQPLLHYPQLAL